jgi:hypothetical protein
MLFVILSSFTNFTCSRVAAQTSVLLSRLLISVAEISILDYRIQRFSAPLSEFRNQKLNFKRFLFMENVFFAGTFWRWRVTSIW